MKHNDKLRKEFEDLTDSSAYSDKEKHQLHYGYALWLEDKIETLLQGQTLPIDSVSNCFLESYEFEFISKAMEFYTEAHKDIYNKTPETLIKINNLENKIQEAHSDSC